MYTEVISSTVKSLMFMIDLFGEFMTAFNWQK